MSTVKKTWFGWVREIPRESGPYLTRWSLRKQERSGGGAWRAYIHRFWDHDVEMHNHPWRWGFSIVLWGSYTERYFDANPEGAIVHYGVRPPIRERRVRWFNWIPATRYHQITELHPRAGRVWTLFVCGPLHGKDWGFWVPGRGNVHHQQRKQERGLPRL